MLKKSLSFIVILLLGLGISFAQSDDPSPVKVKGGFATYDNTKFPVYTGVNEVQPYAKNTPNDGGVYFIISVKSKAEADAAAQKIIKFYTGKTIGKTKIGKFTKSERPDDVLYTSLNGKDEKKKGASVILTVTEEQVSVKLLPMKTDPGMM